MKRLLLLAVAAAASCAAQQKTPVTSIQPDCMVFFSLTTASAGDQAPVGGVGTSVVIDNRQVGCYGWSVAYASHGFSALNLIFQSAPVNTAGTAPGTWATVTVASGLLGVNPNTSTTGAITTALDYSAYYRMNLTSRTGTGGLVGILYGFKVNSASSGGSAPSGPCPAGSSGQVQWNNAGACAGTSGLTANATRVFNANGTGAAPGMSFADGSTGFFRESSFSIGTKDSQLVFSVSGPLTDTLHDNDSVRCREGDEAFQRGICEFDFIRKSNNANFMQLFDSGVSFGDPAGGGAGTRVGWFRKTADGASADTLYAATDVAATTLVKTQAVMLKTPGCAFASLATCFGATSGGHAYCTDCTITSSIDNTATSGGSGCDLAIVNGAYKCTTI